jgi:phthalate 4,5-dioxygenase
MLHQEENELLCRVGPGTPVGALMRQYWIPAVLSDELPDPDCRPVSLLYVREGLSYRALPTGCQRPRTSDGDS